MRYATEERPAKTQTTSSPTTTDLSRGARVEPLDGLRTVAIAFVVFYHLHVPFFGGGFIGVNIFFALSGYLITSILLRERASTGRIQLGRFWLRRIIRLYPVLIAVVVVVVFLWSTIAVYSKSNVDSWFDAALALSYVGNIARWIWHSSMGPLAPTWSLAMEEQFYLVWPPLLAALLAKRARHIGMILVASLLVVGSAVASWLMYRTPGGGATPDIYFSPVLNVGPLLTGAILALLLRWPRVRARLAGRTGTWLAGTGAAFLVAVELWMPSDWTRQSEVFGIILPLVGVASAMLIGGLVTRRTVAARALALRPVAWFGRNASYSLYLWHVPIIALILPLVPGPAGVIAAIAASVLVAIASHYAIERPFARLKNRLEPRLVGGRRPGPTREVRHIDPLAFREGRYASPQGGISR
ncbi:MAG TPA: acyltransferase [Galbitalea sp.]|nr:acyltransferase [Galbitalea sp.]